jgi:hypothetical protein
MLDRARHYKANPPPDDWDGVYTILHKQETGKIARGEGVDLPSKVRPAW